MLRFSAFLSLALLAACKPPASDDYVTRTRIADERKGPSKPIPSPDAEGAIWAPGANANRILFGKPGAHPLMALACEDGSIAFTRFVAADPDAKAVLALIGNGHVQHLWVDATQNGKVWLWRGTLPADDPRLEVFTGSNSIEATVPGAGTIRLSASRLPGELIARCRPSQPVEPFASAGPV